MNKTDCYLIHGGFFFGLFLAVKMEEKCSSETSVGFQWTTRRYIPEDKTLRKDSLDPKGFWRWCITLRVTEFLSMVRNSKEHDVSKTGSVSFLRCGWGETPTLLGPLERGNHNHWRTLVSSPRFIYAPDIMFFNGNKKKLCRLSDRRLLAK
jgi:hypothetical protein